MSSIAAKITRQSYNQGCNRGWARNLMEVQDQERRRISQELHDDLGQRLALLEFQINQLERKCPSADMVEGLRGLRDRVDEIDKDIHRICYELYPVTLDKLGLTVAVNSLCRELAQSSGTSISFEHENVPKDIHQEASLCLYRVIQEALHNISKHAKAKEANVSLRGISERLEVTVTDSGEGFDPFLLLSRRGLGLISIEERVRSAGGSYSIRSSPGSGTEVRAILRHRHAEALAG
jgi:signal transduction histidine kinase